MNKLFIIYFLFLKLMVSAQTELELEKIMKGYEFIGHPPRNHFWSWDNKRIYFEWNPNNELSYSYYFWENGFKEPKKLPLKDYYLLEINDDKQKNKNNKYYLKDGAIFLFDTKTQINKLIYQTDKSVSKLILTENENLIFFIQDYNVFEFNLANNQIIQISNFVVGNESMHSNNKVDFLKDQQKELFEYIKNQEIRKNYNKQISEQTKHKFPKKVFIQNSQIENIQVSKNQNFIIFRLSDYPENKETQFENYITNNGYTQSIKAREKVSIYNLSKHKLGVLNRAKDSVYFVDFSKLSNFNRKPAFLELYKPNDFKEIEERKIAIHELVFDKKGLFNILEIKSLDNKDRWIVNLNLETGQVEELDYQHDPAWIGGPGISEWNFESGTLGFLSDNSSIYFQSEKSGYSHLFTMNLYSKKKVQHTKGDWEVRALNYSEKNNTFYIAANKSHPGNLDFFRFNLNNGKFETILSNEGAHDVKISPDETKIAVLFSTKTNPWELYFGSLKENSNLLKITTSTSKEFQAYSWKNPEVIRFEGEYNTDVYARIYTPKKTNQAAIIFVHGAGYLQNAHNYWSTYYREYMFHNLLVDKGFTVLDIDYRGSDGYGRDFRTGIYRHMGGLDLQDHLDGRKLLIQKYGIDSTKIGIYGGSYGGFITLMALLTNPGKFKCGAALRSVTDWAHYNLEYTSNILNFPETDPEAYRKSSPIYFANNLQDELLMLHGMVDDNVQFQDVVRLSERFIELGKKNWNLAVYPVEAHGFKEAYSWLDEYRRILELFEKTLISK